MIPFPTRAIGFSDAFAPLYSITIILGGSSLPLATLKYDPMPILARSFSLNDFTFKFGKSLVIAFTFFSIILGVAWLAGRSPKYFAVFTPSPIANPFFADDFAFLKSEGFISDTNNTNFLSVGFFTVLFFVSVNIYAFDSIVFETLSIIQKTSLLIG